MFVILCLNRGGVSSSKLVLWCRTRCRGCDDVYVVDGVDANVDAWNSVNTHRFDIWCFCESSRTFDPAVELGTSISGVELPPPALRKFAHIPPTETDFPRQVRSAKRSRFAATVFVRSKPVNLVRILPRMFILLTHTTKTGLLHKFVRTHLLVLTF